MDRNGNNRVGIGEGLDAEKDDERRKKGIDYLRRDRKGNKIVGYR